MFSNFVNTEEESWLEEETLETFFCGYGLPILPTWFPDLHK